MVVQGLLKIKDIVDDRLRGISQERLPYYLGFFENLHNIRKRGQVARAALAGLLVVT